MNTYIIRATVLALVSLLLASCAASRVKLFQDDIVTVEEADPPLLLLNVHGSSKRYLTVRGETYGGVTGIAPFYLNLPELDSILFVTRQSGSAGRATIHVVKKRLNGAIEIDIGNDDFGGNIGLTRDAGGKFSDTIERIDSGRIWLVSRKLLTTRTIVLNLERKIVERTESVTLDESGHVKRHYINSVLQMQ